MSSASMPPDSFGSMLASSSIESAWLASTGASTVRGGVFCTGALAAEARRGSPLRGGGGAGSASSASTGASFWESFIFARSAVGVYLISENGADTAGLGEPLMRSGAVGGTPAEANVRPCNHMSLDDMTQLAVV